MESMDIEKRKKFIEIATKRVNNVKDSIRILSNCSNDNYEYNEEDVNEMMTALQETLDEAEKRFRERFKKDVPFEFSSSLDLKSECIKENIKTKPTIDSEQEDKDEAEGEGEYEE